MDFDGQRGMLSSNFNENGMNLTLESHFTGKILMELDPWISPYSARVRESILQDFVDQTKCTRNEHVASNIPNFSNPTNVGNYPILDSANIPVEMIFSQSSCNIQGPRFTSTTTVTPNATRDEITQPFFVEMGNKLQLSRLNSSQLGKMDGQEEIGQLNMEYFSSWFNNIGSGTRIDNHEGCSQSESPFYIPQQKELHQETQFDNFLAQDITLGDNMINPSKEHKSGSWEWEDLLLEEHLNLQDFS
ncbi:elongation factor P [Striga asiatica]|uniref:Elongation factor P n=1 Tax=Striga asiatica TaxID=4170 RepID=A0A5A7QRB9_STRAF|nr:elongation factor P [Striga asiatica]